MSSELKVTQPQAMWSTNPFVPFIEETDKLYKCQMTGKTVREFVRQELGVEEEFLKPTICVLNGKPLMREFWDTRVLTDTDILQFMEIPAGGDGGGKQILMLVMVLVVIVAVAFIAPSLGAAFASSGVGQSLGITAATATQIIGGVITATSLMLITTFLTPTPDQPKDEPESPTYSLESRGNRGRLEEVVPVLYGRHIVFPDYIAEPFTNYEGQKQRNLDYDYRPVTGEDVSQQYLYQLFCITLGELEVESVRVGDRIVSEESNSYFEDIEIQLVNPGSTVELYGPGMTVSDVARTQLVGPNNRAKGQIYPVNIDQEFVSLGAGTNTITIAASTDTSTWTTDSLSGFQIFISDQTEDGAQLTATDSDYHKRQEINNTTDTYDNPRYGAHHERLANPYNLFDITGNTFDSQANEWTITVNRPWSEWENASVNRYVGVGNKFHIRDDWYGPFVINPSGTEVNRIYLDIGGPPMYAQGSSRRVRIGCGLRVEYREIDDVGSPLEPFQGLGRDWRGYLALEGDVGGNNANISFWKRWIIVNGGWNVRSRFANVALYGPSLTDPIRLTLNREVLNGRYEIRIKRSTYEWLENPSVINDISFLGARGKLTEQNRTYPDITAMATIMKASELVNNTTKSKVSVVGTRKLPQYGSSLNKTVNGAFTALPFSSVLQVNVPDHRLVEGQTVTISNVSGAPGILPQYSGTINGEYEGDWVVFSVPDPDSFLIELLPNQYTTVDTTSGTATFTAKEYTSALLPTTNPAWALVDLATNPTYGAGFSLSQLNMNSIREFAATCFKRGDEFNFVFDQELTFLDAANTICRAGRARVFFIGGRLTVIRDEPQAAYTCVFGPDNMLKDSFKIDYAFMSPNSPDSIKIEYMDNRVWKYRDVHCYLPEKTSDNPVNMKLNGITSSAQAWREGMYQTAVNWYQRKTITFQTEFEGHLPMIGSLVRISHPMPKWGQSGQLVSYNANSNPPEIELEEPLNYFDEIVLDAEKVDPALALGDTVTLYNHNDELAFASFETGSDGFVGEDGVFTFLQSNPEVDDAYLGDRVLRIEAGSSGAPGNYLYLESDFVNSTANAANPGNICDGTVFKTSCYVRASNAQTVGMTCALVPKFVRSGSVSSIGSSTSWAKVTLTSEWQYLEAYRQIDVADCVALKPYVGLNSVDAFWDVAGGNTAGDSFEIDNFRVELSELPQVQKSYRSKSGKTSTAVHKNGPGGTTLPWAYAETRWTIPSGEADKIVEGSFVKVTGWVYVPEYVQATEVKAFVRCIPFLGTANSDTANAQYAISQINSQGRGWTKVHAEGQIPASALTSGPLTRLHLMMGFSGAGLAQDGDVCYWDDMKITIGSPRAICLKKPDGSVDGPLLVSPASSGKPNAIGLPGVLTWQPITSEGNSERTLYVVGGIQATELDGLVTGITPRSESIIDIECKNYDARVHTADQTVQPTEVVVPTTITEVDAPKISNLNLTISGDGAAQFAEASWDAAEGANSYLVEYGWEMERHVAAPILNQSVKNGPFVVNEQVSFFAPFEKIPVSRRDTSIISLWATGVFEVSQGLSALNWIWGDYALNPDVPSPLDEDGNLIFFTGQKIMFLNMFTNPDGQTPNSIGGLTSADLDYKEHTVGTIINANSKLEIEILLAGSPTASYSETLYGYLHPNQTAYYATKDDSYEIYAGEAAFDQQDTPFLYAEKAGSYPVETPKTKYDLEKNATTIPVRTAGFIGQTSGAALVHSAEASNSSVYNYSPISYGAVTKSTNHRTSLTELSPLVPSSADNYTPLDYPKIYGVRVAAIGRLRGPWVYATTVFDPSANENSFNSNRDLSFDRATGNLIKFTPETMEGSLMDNDSDPLGVLLSSFLWVEADGTNAVVVSGFLNLSPHHEVRAVFAETTDAWVGGSTTLLEVGTTQGATGEYALFLDVTSTGKYYATESGSNGSSGASLGIYKSATRTAQVRVSSANQANMTAGRTRIRIDYVYVPIDPSLV